MGNNKSVGLLAITLIVLKLTEVIDWSWWWVTLPLWGGAASGLFAALMVLMRIGARSRDNDDRW